MTHAGDALSALLDGQLGIAEADQVRAHVAECSACAAELDAVREARRLVRELPAAEPPARYFEALLRDGLDAVVVELASRRPRFVLANAAVAATVAVVLLGLTATGIAPAPVEPGVATAIERHASTVSALQASGSIERGAHPVVPPQSVPPTTAKRRSVSSLSAPYVAPDTLDEYELVDAYAASDGVHLLYRRGRYALSVFEVAGTVDWDALPADGTRLDVAGHDAWRSETDGADGRLYVIEDDGLVVVVIGDETGDAVEQVAMALPDAPSVPLRARVQQTVARALELLSPAP